MNLLIEFTPPVDEAGGKKLIEILDNCGLDYRLGQPSRSARVVCGQDLMNDPSPLSLVAFLQAHGGKFEDS